MRPRLAAALALALLAACDVATKGPTQYGNATFQILNGARSAGSMRIYLDGRFLAAIPLGSLAIIQQIGGSHTIEVRRFDESPGFIRNVVFSGSEIVSVIAWDSAGFLTPALLSDSNAVVPAGASKLRVAHYAESAGPIDIWRTQPDFATPTRIQFPFPYLTTSPYIQSTPGDWRVLVSDTVPQATPGGPMPDTLGLSNPITITDGRSRTIVVIDKVPTGVQFVVMEP